MLPTRGDYGCGRINRRGAGSLRHSKYSSFQALVIPSTRHSRSLVSVCRRASSFKRRLTDTCVLGNLPKTGTGFGKVHASLREIPEGDEKYSRYPGSVKTPKIKRRMKNFPTDIAKTRIKMDKFPISPLFLCDFEEYFPTLSICGGFLHRLYRSLFFYHSRVSVFKIKRFFRMLACSLQPTVCRVWRRRGVGVAVFA